MSSGFHVRWSKVVRLGAITEVKHTTDSFSTPPQLHTLTTTVLNEFNRQTVGASPCCCYCTRWMRVRDLGCLESKETELISRLVYCFSIGGRLVPSLLLLYGDLKGCLQKLGWFASLTALQRRPNGLLEGVIQKTCFRQNLIWV